MQAAGAVDEYYNSTVELLWSASNASSTSLIVSESNSSHFWGEVIFAQRHLVDFDDCRRGKIEILGSPEYYSVHFYYLKLLHHIYLPRPLARKSEGGWFSNSVQQIDQSNCWNLFQHFNLILISLLEDLLHFPGWFARGPVCLSDEWISLRVKWSENSGIALWLEK